MPSRSRAVAKKPNITRGQAAARPRGISKAATPAPQRRSLRLLAAQAISDLTPDDSSKKCKQHLFDHAASISPEKKQKPNGSSQKRKQDSSDHATPITLAKKQGLDPIEHWRREGNWPKELFEADTMPVLAGLEDSFAARTLSRKRSIGGSSTSARDLNREEKAAPYQHPRYEQALSLKDFYMSEHDRGPNKKAIETYKELFQKHVALPQNTGFADHLFEQTIKDMHGKNEARIIRDIGLLICPSPEDLFKRKAIKTKYLCESVDESWRLAQPITSTRPQPDFSVGYTRDAFTEEQLDKLRDVLRNSDDQASFLRATWYMYFPFLSCEAKKGDGGLDVADRQNAHSMGIAVRAVVLLFHFAGRAKELDGQILAFSVSYNDTSVRIYGYYPRIRGANVTYHRHRIVYLSLMESTSTKGRWETYRFVSNIYEHWASAHLKRLQAIAAKIPHRVVPKYREGSALSQDFSRSSVLEDQQRTDPTTSTEMPAPATPNTIASSSRSQKGLKTRTSIRSLKS